MWRRRLLIVLLVLALPLQGYAAAGMLWCAPVHPSQALHVQHVPHAQGEPAAHSAHSHGTAVSAGEAHAPHHAGATADEEGAQTGGGKCSQCAVCNVGVALLPAVPLLGVPRAPESVVLQPSRLPAAFLTGGIERPPRALRA